MEYSVGFPQTAAFGGIFKISFIFLEIASVDYETYVVH